MLLSDTMFNNIFKHLSFQFECLNLRKNGCVNFSISSPRRLSQLEYFHEYWILHKAHESEHAHNELVYARS